MYERKGDIFLKPGVLAANALRSSSYGGICVLSVTRGSNYSHDML